MPLNKTINYIYFHHFQDLREQSKRINPGLNSRQEEGIVLHIDRGYAQGVTNYKLNTTAVPCELIMCIIKTSKTLFARTEIIK